MVWGGSSVTMGTKVQACKSSIWHLPLMGGVPGQLVTWVCLASLLTGPTCRPGNGVRQVRTLGALGTHTGPAPVCSELGRSRLPWPHGKLL